MPSVRPFLVSLLTVIPLLGAELPEWFEPFDADAVRADVERARQCSLVIHSLNPEGDAARGGLQAGDHIVGLDGIRIYDTSDYNGMRWFYADLYQPMRLDVLRGDTLTTLTIRTRTPRTAGFIFSTIPAASDPLLIHLDPSGALASNSDSLTAWDTFPGKHRHAIVRWLGNATPEADRAWIPSLFAKWRALCMQDFAGAAAIPTPAMPILGDFAAFLDRIAQRNAQGEVDPSPVACGVDALTFALQYPWPISNGPALGEISPAQLNVDIDDFRRVPKRNLHEHEQHQKIYDQMMQIINAIPQEQLPDDPDAQEYVLCCARATLDSERHGGWPYRSHLVADKEKRTKLLTSLRAAIDAQPQTTGTWTCMAEICASYAEVALERGSVDRFSQGLQAVKPRLEQLAKRSPWLAWHCIHILSNTNLYGYNAACTQTIRELYEHLDLWPSEKPSRFLAFIDARRYDPLFRDIPTSGAFHEGYRYLAHHALTLPMTYTEIMAGFKNLSPQSNLAQTAALMDAWVVVQRAQLTLETVKQLDPHIIGNALGLLIDRMPTIMRWQSFRWSEKFATDAIRYLCLADRIDYDLPAIRTALARVDTKDSDLLGRAIEDIRLRHGSLVGTLVLADICAERGLAEQASSYRQKIRDTYDAIFTSMRWGRWVGSDQSASHWQALMTFASSPATAAWAREYGETHLKTRRERQAWTCSHLSMAQAAFYQNDLPAVVHHLVESFTGVESKGTEGFVIAGVVIRGEPRMRTWLITQLAQAKALDPAACARITQAAKPGYLEDEALALLGATADTVGQPATGDNDF